MKKHSLLLLLVLLSLSWGGVAAAQKTLNLPVWMGTWASSQQAVEPQNSIPSEDLHDVTLRQICHLSAGGTSLRIHLSNAFGSIPVHFSSVHIAKPLSAALSKIDPATDRPLSFFGSVDVIVPAGADYLSDPIDYPVAALSDLAITLHVDKLPADQTGHPGARATSYYVHGDSAAAEDLPSAKKIDHWYYVSGVDVSAQAGASTIVTLGDSITDGRGATTNANNRWPDILSQRLQASTAMKNIGVLNKGIGGNHLLTDGLGPNVLARFDRDVLAQSGVRYLVVLEGVNDLGGLTRERAVSPREHSALVHQILAAYQQIVVRAHAHGIKVIGATILPYSGSEYYHPGPANEADRQAVNAWIRAAGHFDAVIDFDKIIRDPEHLDRLLPLYDSGDHLHPSPAGYRTMAEAIPLALFVD